MNKCLLQSSTWRVWDEAGNIVSNELAATMAKLLLSWKLNFSCCSTNGFANWYIWKRKCFPICLSRSLPRITCGHQAAENSVCVWQERFKDSVTTFRDIRAEHLFTTLKMCTVTSWFSCSSKKCISLVPTESRLHPQSITFTYSGFYSYSVSHRGRK